MLLLPIVDDIVGRNNYIVNSNSKRQKQTPRIVEHVSVFVKAYSNELCHN